MKRMWIKRGLAVTLAVLFLLPDRVVIAAEEQAKEVVEQQEERLSGDTEEISDSGEKEGLDKKEIQDGEEELDKKEELDEEYDLDKEGLLTEESTGDKEADPEIEDQSEGGMSTEEVKETPVDPDDDGDKEHYETEIPASKGETDTEEDPSLEWDEEDAVEDELPDIEVEQEWAIEKNLKAATPPVQPLALEEEDSQNVVIGEGATSVEGFLNDADLVNISIADSVTIIGPGAFNGCPNLTSVNIPDSVTTIGPGAFRECPSLTSINIPASVTTIENETFYGCSNLTDIDIAEGVTTIGASAFCFCSSLTSIEIPDSVTTIGSSAFAWTNLTSIEIPDSVTIIESSAFMACSNLTDITIPASVTTIGTYAFDGCSSLTDIAIPDSVTAIGAYAFAACTGLTSIEIPENVDEIGSSAFYGCSSLKSIKIQNGVSNIGNGAFAECSSLTEIDIPGNVKVIREGAFANCNNLENVDLSEGILEIHQSAFQCANLMSIVIPASVRTIGAQAFGYYFDYNTLDIKRNDGFIIMGISGSAAERYAIDNDFTFIALDTLVDPIITTTELPVGVRYAPYEALIENSSTNSWNTVTYSLVDGALPSGIDLDSYSGRLYGVPMGTGTSTFTVRMENSFSRFPDREKTFSITTIDNTDWNVADYTDAGYEITQRVQDMMIDLAYDQTVVSRGSFDEFTTVFIDGVELVRDVDYIAEEGSTRITIMRQTFQRFASIGIHTISIEFRTRDKGLLKRAIQNYEIKATNSGNSSSGGGSGGHRDRGSSSDGAPANVIMVIFDPKKGYVHTVTGIIPREWAGYSHWVKDEKGWRLVYADGTEACGYMVEQADGDALEQVLWEMVDGAWYAFGADGYLKSGWFFDHQLSGWYCLSAEDGMHTGWYHDPQDDHDYYLDQTTGRISAGWRQIDGKWYYFKADITPPTWKFDKDTGTWAYDPMNINKPYGAMYHREWTPDRYYVDDDGVWDPNVGS